MTRSAHCRGPTTYRRCATPGRERPQPSLPAASRVRYKREPGEPETPARFWKSTEELYLKPGLTAFALLRFGESRHSSRACRRAEADRAYFLRAAPASSATAPSVVCAAFKPRRKSLSEYAM